MASHPQTLRLVQPADAAGDLPLAQRAYDVLFAAIQGGALAPGSRKRETELTEWLGMSRTPLRDALQRLEAEGLLRLEPYRGVLISKLDRQAVVELYAARAYAEGAAAALAARAASPAEVTAMEDILALERQAAADPAEGARLNRLLHGAIHDCCRNRFLLGNLHGLSALLALVGNATRRDPARVSEAQLEHTALVAAIAAGDVAAAEGCARRHVTNAQRCVLAAGAGTLW